jgi:hypothetical protein
MAESMSTIFSYDDAKRVVEEVRNQLIEEREALAGQGASFITNAMMQARIDEVTRLASILSIEPAVQNFLLKSYEREEGQNG